VQGANNVKRTIAIADFHRFRGSSRKDNNLKQGNLFHDRYCNKMILLKGLLPEDPERSSMLSIISVAAAVALEGNRIKESGLRWEVLCA